MRSTRIAILGGGLSGLYAAYLLEQRGMHDYVLLEASQLLGGRIKSVSSPVANIGEKKLIDLDRFDLGATWFWPSLQINLNVLINELKIDKFEQYEIGDMLFERQIGLAIRTQGYSSAPPSARLAGGMSAIIEKLGQCLNPESIIVDQQVNSLKCTDEFVEIDALSSEGRVTRYRAQQILLAVPPRLAITNISFSPPLPSDFMNEWQETSTWMAPHAKYLAIYDTPFWRKQGLSGEARSDKGPLAEIHDASNPHGKAALFGFLGIPAINRKSLSYSDMCLHCRAQLVRLFGPEASKPQTEFIKDWARDSLTSTKADLQSQSTHDQRPRSKVNNGAWLDRLVGAASEWSPRFPGYVAGAIEAATLGVEDDCIRKKSHIFNHDKLERSDE